ncbi:hypothetical protein ACVGW2_05880, partial [Enterobacter intestinihominis]
EPAKEALDLYYANRGKKPVVGVGLNPIPPAHHLGPRAGGVAPQLQNWKNKKKPPEFVYKNAGCEKKNASALIKKIHCGPKPTHVYIVCSPIIKKKRGGGG